jgi:hypothetical protein
VKHVAGYALYLAQAGSLHPHAKPLSGFGGAGVHAFQKKSRRGISTPKHDMNVIRARLKEAERLHAQRKEQRG